jgi:hypothetical protein
MPTQFRVSIAQLAHQIPPPVGEGVELLLHSRVGARLSVLQQRDEQKRNDRRHRVDPSCQVSTLGSTHSVGTHNTTTST